jgi:hypothetical protein
MAPFMYTPTNYKSINLQSWPTKSFDIKIYINI